MQKAEASGPDTVAMVYLAGYGMQLAGENYFIPVDSPIGRETDIPTEGLRIGDYLRQLASLPLKAGIVVLDAARPQPFIEGGQPIAGGLALVEPEPHMLIAFNAAPGTVAPVEQGSYGAYAQSLAEMIRTGGLPLPELFDRVRLRVNEATKGAQVPWHAHKLDSNFVFFDRAPDAPVQAQPDQVAAIRSKPIRDLGVQDAYAAALERDTLPAYEEFVAAYPGDPLAKRVRALAAARREAIVWQRTYRADTPEAYWSYLRRYPNGPHAADARRRLAILTSPPEPPPSFAMMRLRRAAAAAGRDRLCRSAGAGFQRSVFRLRTAAASAGVLPAATAAGICRAGATAAADRIVHPAAADLRAVPGLCPSARLCAAAAEQHHLRQHPQQADDRHRHQPSAAGGAIRARERRKAQRGRKGADLPVVAPAGAATPGLPPSVAQRATLIQQGKAAGAT